MSCIQRKTFALALVAVMLLSVPLTVSICDDDSDAANAVDYTRWYYNQLDEPMKFAYNGLLNSTSDSTTVEVDIPNSVIGNLYDDCVDGKSEKLEYACEMLYGSLHEERPETYCIDYYYDFKYTGTTITDLKIKFEIQDENTSQKNKAVEDVISTLNFEGNTIEKIKSIHDYVAKTLTYNYEEFEEEQETGITNWEIRSLYRALVGDHNVVCEGYAKAFRAICEHNGITCLLVSGYANGHENEGHMWNIVLVEGAWYTVDVTWDDDITSFSDTYLLVGQNTICDGSTVAKSHDLRKMSEVFRLNLPMPLATNKYGSDVATISFDTGGGPTIDPITIKAGTVPTIPEPTWSGHTFVAWYLDSDFTEMWSYSAISSDCCLYAKWISTEGHSSSFEISGIYWAIIVVAAILIIGAVVVKRHR